MNMRLEKKDVEYSTLFTEGGFLGLALLEANKVEDAGVGGGEGRCSKGGRGRRGEGRCGRRGREENTFLL